jgi:hypothetical protein
MVLREWLILSVVSGYGKNIFLDWLNRWLLGYDLLARMMRFVLVAM